MTTSETAPVVATRAVQKDRCDATGIHDTAPLGHSLLARYLSEFADARRALRGQLVCVRFSGSALDAGLCDVTGRVKAADRTGLLLVTPGHVELDGSEVVVLIPWVQVERVVVGWSADVFPEEVAS
ncbi:hypothetical protein [Microbacterium sp. NPDC057650]|uniref:hypothetical protein n=1 Tax=unclassified Microbacterium TaxID=2609290 RepID=UPI00366D2D5B